MAKNSRPPSQRQLRVGEEIRHCLSQIFLQENFWGSKLQGLSITVSEVRVSPDLKNATVFVALFGGGSVDFVAELNAIALQLRHEMGRRLTLRHTPKLYFRLDDSFDRAQRIEDLLASVVPLDSREGDSQL